MLSNRERLTAIVHMVKRVSHKEAEALVSTLTHAEITAMLNSKVGKAASEYLELTSRIADLTAQQDLAKDRLNKALQEKQDDTTRNL